MTFARISEHAAEAGYQAKRAALAAGKSEEEAEKLGRLASARVRSTAVRAPAGAFAGAVLGTAFLPIPVVGTVVGGIAGFAIGMISAESNPGLFGDIMFGVRSMLKGK